MLGYFNSTLERSWVNSKENEQLKLFGFRDSWNYNLKKFFQNQFKGSFLSVGPPGSILQRNGIPNKEIGIKVRTLASKIKKHSLKSEMLVDLPLQLNKPLLIFKSLTVDNAFNIIINQSNHEGILCVSVHPDRKIRKLVVNEIASIHGRRVVQLERWVEKDALLYPQKRKAIDFLRDSGFNCPKSKKSNSFNTKLEEKSKKAKNHKKSPDLLGVTPLDTWKPNSKIIKLPGDLGAFLGGYERKQYAVVLRGEKGAGKTRLLCQLIDLFAKKNLKSLFLSLEVSPQSELFGSYISCIGKATRQHVSVSACKDVQELEKYCKQYDLVAIDSWSKLNGVRQEDFIRLVEKYPGVLFLVIFQSTTAGTSRGGVMPEFDCSAVIQVHKGGGAQCEKNRYNSCDQIYNVFTQKLMSNETSQTINK